MDRANPMIKNHIKYTRCYDQDCTEIDLPSEALRKYNIYNQEEEKIKFRTKY